MTDDGGAGLLRFPFSRVPLGRREPARDLGSTPMTRAFGSERMSAHGHWCNHCRGIWYSSFGEIECPVCGNRHG